MWAVNKDKTSFNMSSFEAAKEMEMGGQGLLNVKLKVSNSAEKNPGVHG